MVLISKKPHKPYKIDVPVMTYWLELFIYVIGGIFFVIVYDFDMMMLAAPILSIVYFMIAKGIRKNSDYRSEMLSSLLGFQEFLKTTEKDRLEMLLEEDPEYYYHILPYARYCMSVICGFISLKISLCHRQHGMMGMNDMSIV